MCESSGVIGVAKVKRSCVLSIPPPQGEVMDFDEGRNRSDCVSVC